MSPKVTLIGKPGCHLCDDARAVIARVCGELAIQWDELSILDDPELADEYWELIPVTLIDGHRHAVYRVDPQRLRAELTDG